MLDILWFHDIFNALSLSLVCVQKPFCIDFYVSVSLFARKLSKDECGSFCARNVENLPPTELVTVCWWHRRESAEGK